MQRVFRVVNTAELKPVGPKTTNAFNRSVRRFGVLNPVLLAEAVDADGVIELGIIDGNRRVRAAKVERLPKVPAVVLKATTKQDRARLTLMCNYMRSGNFHTESSAILSLAANEDAAADAARAIGLGPAKMQQLYRKIATMPEPVRRAMREHRIPVSAAMWVGAWPEGLQRELIELLDRRRYVNTTMMRDLREWYAERHPEEFGIVVQVEEDVPLDAWSNTGSDVVEIPAPAVAAEAGSQRAEAVVPPVDAMRDRILAEPHELVAVPHAATAGPVSKEVRAESVLPEHGRSGSMWLLHDQRADTEPVPATLAPSERPDPTPPEWGYPASEQPAAAIPRPPFGAPLPSTSPASVEPATVAMASHESGSVPIAVTDTQPEPRITADDRAERMVAFVVRLDATLRDLVREGKALGIDRSIWVDRAMRAWDGVGG